MHKKRFFCGFAALLVSAMLLNMADFAGMAEGTLPEQEVSAASSRQSTADTYYRYLDAVQTEPAGENVTVFEGQQRIEEGAAADFTVSVQRTGCYRVGWWYLAMDERKNNLTAGLFVDGEQPYKGLANLEMHRLWENDPDAVQFVEDGNDIRPTLVEKKDWQWYVLQDCEGMVAEPFVIFLEAGEHVLRLENTGGDFCVRELQLIGTYTPLPSYEAYRERYAGEAVYTGEPLVIEAEDFTTVSSRTLVASTDITDVHTSPSSPRYTKLNVMGGTNWRYIGDEVIWTVEAPQAGLYHLSLRFRQNFYNGISTHRCLRVNGEIPFQEAADIALAYGFNWQYEDLDGCYIYLREGENTLSLTAVLGENAAVLNVLQNLIYDLNLLYRKIITVTGTSPDPYRDYDLQSEIPTLLSDLEARRQDVEELFTLIETYYGSGGSEVSLLSEIRIQLRDMQEKPAVITQSSRLKRLKTNISSLGTWANKLREQPAALDRLALYGGEIGVVQTAASFWETVVYKFQRFVNSFIQDYNVMGDTQEWGQGEPLRVWISTGRDQAQLLKNMVSDTFTPQYGIPVQVELVSGGLIEAILAGQGPDIALDRAETDPVNYAMRNALYNLAQFDDYEEVAARFSEGSTLPFAYKGGIYGLPITQSFDMLFYRTDIFAELGLSVPQTWEELILYVLPVLQANNMTAGVGALTDGDIFRTLLYQNGGSIYTPDLLSSALDTQQAYEAFRMGVSFFSEYDIPQTYDFMNRFRTGEMPLAIAAYTMYNNLNLGAPELNGLWEMVCIPGIEGEEGINNTQILKSTAAVINAGTASPENAWTFLKWFLSGDIQGRYGNEIESILGVSGRYSPANMEAMRQLPWGSRQLEMLEAQRAVSTALPNLPGSYFTARAIRNAFVLAVLDSNEIPRELLLHWSEEIDLELERKRKEFD